MDSDTAYPDVEGFDIKPIETQLDSKEFRINIRNESEFEQWKNAFCENIIYFQHNTNNKRFTESIIPPTAQMSAWDTRKEGV